MATVEGGGGGNSSQAEELAVGCLLAIRTTLGDEFEGQVVTFDRHSNILVLQEGEEGASASSKGKGRGRGRNIRLLKANYIKDFTFLAHCPDPLDPNGCFLDLSALQAREQLALRLKRTMFMATTWIGEDDRNLSSLFVLARRRE